METCEVTFRGRTFKIASLSYKQAREFVAEGKKLLAPDSNTPSEVWIGRRDKLVIDSLNAALPATDPTEANSSTWNIERLGELTMPMIDFLHAEILRFSGLRTGEAEAASALPKSEAA